MRNTLTSIFVQPLNSNSNMVYNQFKMKGYKVFNKDIQIPIWSIINQKV